MKKLKNSSQLLMSLNSEYYTSKDGLDKTKTETKIFTTKTKTLAEVGSQDQDFQKTNSSALDTKTLVSRTTSLELTLC